MRLYLVLCVGFLCCSSSFVPFTAIAGPNAGGTLILALSEGTTYSVGTNYCDAVTTPNCESAVTSGGTDGSVVVVNCLAAFENGGRLLGITFGIDYDPDALRIVAFGACGNFELPGGSWPAPRSGTALTWATAQTGSLVPVYWFAAANYYAPDPHELVLVPHPTQGGNFADDSVPSQIDRIAGFGSFGFGTGGAAPCNVPVGACCVPDGCEVWLPEDCHAAGGVYQGDGSTCNPSPCTGACCYADGTCEIVSESVCSAEGGVYQGNDLECTPGLCTDTVLGACCFADGSCLELNDYDCEAQGGEPQDQTFCHPNPCGEVGACCYVGGTCLVVTADQCRWTGGWYVGDGTACNPNPCPPPSPGACCLSDGTCRFLQRPQCQADGGTYQGDGTVCYPNPCPPPPTGACCFPDYSCQELNRNDCEAAGGIYEGDGERCEPHQCAPPTPTRDSSWGAIKRLYHYDDIERRPY